MTVNVPKCCEGYENIISGRCTPICNIRCASGVCSAPNVCKEVELEETASTITPETDYYDENSSETSTPEEELVEMTTTKPSEEPAEVTAGTDGNTVEVTTWTNVDEEGSGENTGPLEEETQHINWILWASVASAALTLCAIGYIVFAKMLRHKKMTQVGSIEQVVSYSK